MLADGCIGMVGSRSLVLLTVMANMVVEESTEIVQSTIVVFLLASGRGRSTGTVGCSLGRSTFWDRR